MKILRIILYIKKRRFLHNIKDRKKRVQFAISIFFILLSYFYFFNNISNLYAVIFSQNIGRNIFIGTIKIFISLFIISHIISGVFFKNYSHKTDILEKVKYYPVLQKRKFIYEVIVESISAVSLFFTPFYFGLLYIFRIIKSDFILLIALFGLFIPILLLINGIILLFDKISIILGKNRYYRMIGVFLLFFIFTSLIIYSTDNPMMFERYFNGNSLYLFNYLPTNLWVDTALNFHSINSEFIFTYLIISGLYLFIIMLMNNYLYKISRKKLPDCTRKNNVFLKLNISRYLNLSPLILKETIYFFRSPRTQFSSLIYLIIIIFALRNRNFDQIYSIFFVIYVILYFINSNLFAYDYRAVINYFFRPVTLHKVLFYKVKLFKILLIILILAFCTGATLNLPSYNKKMIFVGISVIIYFFVIDIYKLFSILFPYSVPFYYVVGKIPVFIYLASLFNYSILVGFIYLLENLFANIFPVILALLIILLFIVQKKIMTYFAFLLSKRKENIIDALK